jgi:hypothetical protein
MTASARPASPIARTFEVTQVTWNLDAPYAEFTRAFESLLGRMGPEPLSEVSALSAEAARTRLASFVGPLDFTLFQRLDHGALVASLYGQHARAVTYVIGNALIAGDLRSAVVPDRAARIDGGGCRGARARCEGGEVGPRDPRSRGELVTRATDDAPSTSTSKT